MKSKSGVSLVELLVVLAIIGTLLGLLLPAVQMARERARETVCKNNVHQINLAVTNHLEVHKKLPRRGVAGKMGGWIVDVLPFIEQQNLHSSIVIGSNVANAADELHVPPPIFRCPKSSDLETSPSGQMARGHYTLVTLDSRKHFAGVSDSPVGFSVPWGTGPEMDYKIIFKETGPHHRGFYFSQGSQQGVGFMLDGQAVQ